MKNNLGGKKNNDIAALEARIAKLEQSMRGIPGRFPVGGRVPHAVLEIIDGNLIEIFPGGDPGGPYAGVKYYPNAITELATAYDPEAGGETTVTSYPDGIGRAWLWLDGVRQDKRVLVLNDTSAFIYFVLLAGDPLVGFRSRSIPVAGGGSATVWSAS